MYKKRRASNQSRKLTERSKKSPQHQLFQCYYCLTPERDKILKGQSQDKQNLKTPSTFAPQSQKDSKIHLENRTKNNDIFFDCEIVDTEQNSPETIVESRQIKLMSHSPKFQKPAQIYSLKKQDHNDYLPLYLHNQQQYGLSNQKLPATAAKKQYQILNLPSQKQKTLNHSASNTPSNTQGIFNLRRSTKDQLKEKLQDMKNLFSNFGVTKKEIPQVQVDKIPKQNTQKVTTSYPLMLADITQNSNLRKTLDFDNEAYLQEVCLSPVDFNKNDYERTIEGDSLLNLVTAFDGQKFRKYEDGKIHLQNNNNMNDKPQLDQSQIYQTKSQIHLLKNMLEKQKEKYEFQIQQINTVLVTIDYLDKQYLYQYFTKLQGLLSKQNNTIDLQILVILSMLKDDLEDQQKQQEKTPEKQQKQSLVNDGPPQEQVILQENQQRQNVLRTSYSRINTSINQQQQQAAANESSKTIGPMLKSSRKSLGDHPKSLYQKIQTEEQEGVESPRLQSLDVSISADSIGEDNHFAFSPIRDHFTGNESQQSKFNAKKNISDSQQNLEQQLEKYSAKPSERVSDKIYSEKNSKNDSMKDSEKQTEKFSQKQRSQQNTQKNREGGEVQKVDQTEVMTFTSKFSQVYSSKKQSEQFGLMSQQQQQQQQFIQSEFFGGAKSPTAQQQQSQTPKMSSPQDQKDYFENRDYQRQEQQIQQVQNQATDQQSFRHQGPLQTQRQALEISNQNKEIQLINQKNAAMQKSVSHKVLQQVEDKLKVADDFVEQQIKKEKLKQEKENREHFENIFKETIIKSKYRAIQRQNIQFSPIYEKALAMKLPKQKYQGFVVQELNSLVQQSKQQKIFSNKNKKKDNNLDINTAPGNNHYIDNVSNKQQSTKSGAIEVVEEKPAQEEEEETPSDFRNAPKFRQFLQMAKKFSSKISHSKQSSFRNQPSDKDKDNNSQTQSSKSPMRKRQYIKKR